MMAPSAKDSTPGGSGQTVRGQAAGGLRIAAVFLAATAVIGGASVLLCRHGILDTVIDRVAPGVFDPPAASSQPQHFKDMLTYHRRMDPSIPDGAIIFLGDSITLSLAVVAVSPLSVNLGIGNETTALLLDALPSYQALHRAGGIVVAIGINDILQARSEGLPGRLQDIERRLPANRRLVWNAIMPTRQAVSDEAARRAIMATNLTIKALCTARRSCTFVDTWKLFGDENGIMDQRYFLSDGVHLNSEGYRKWVQALRVALAAPTGAADRG